MEREKQVIIATAEGIAKGYLVQVEAGIRLTPLGMRRGDELWSKFSDLDKFLLAGFLKRATPDA